MKHSYEKKAAKKRKCMKLSNQFSNKFLVRKVDRNGNFSLCICLLFLPSIRLKLDYFYYIMILKISNINETTVKENEKVRNSFSSFNVVSIYIC